MLSVRSALVPGPRPKWEHRRNFPDRSNLVSPPAEPGGYQNEIIFIFGCNAEEDGVYSSQIEPT